MMNLNQAIDRLHDWEDRNVDPDGWGWEGLGEGQERVIVALAKKFNVSVEQVWDIYFY